MFSEGMSLEDVHRVMERYMEKVEGRLNDRGKSKEAKQRKYLVNASQADWRTTNPDEVYAL